MNPTERFRARWHYENEPETRAALDLIFGDHFSRDEPGIFAPVRETLLDRGDFFMHLADLTSYAQAQQRLGELYADAEAWARRAIINVATGRVDQIDKRTDVYGLAAILLLTGEPPFLGKSIVEILHQVIHTTPQPPRERLSDISPELERVCLLGDRTRFADIVRIARCDPA